jgi:hypothetical protein
MSDQKLLELAATAIGYQAIFNAVDACQLWTLGVETEYVQFWNPLEDDADAFRLAVKLGISIPTPMTDQFYANHHLCGTIKEVGNDPYSATRRAIVRVAAEIGRSM